MDCITDSTKLVFEDEYKRYIEQPTTIADHSAT